MRSMCAAITDGATCKASLETTPGRIGETRLCADRIHRYRWNGRSWTVDLTYRPANKKNVAAHPVPPQPTHVAATGDPFSDDLPLDGKAPNVPPTAPKGTDS